MYSKVSLRRSYISTGLKSNESILFRSFRESNDVEISSTPKVSLLSNASFSIYLNSFDFFLPRFDSTIQSAIEIRLYKIEFDYYSISPSNKYKISVKEFSNCRKIYFNSYSKFKKIEITCWKFRILISSFLLNSKVLPPSTSALWHILSIYIPNLEFLYEKRNYKG